MVLPTIALVVGGFASLTMLTKNCFLEEIRKQYVLTARAKGASEQRVLYGHVFRNAMLLIIAGFPAAFIGILFTSALLIEIIFSLDGLGLLGFEAAIRRDYPVMFGTLYIFTLLGLVMQIVGDMLYTVVDPRIDFERAAIGWVSAAPPRGDAAIAAHPPALGDLPRPPARLLVALDLSRAVRHQPVRRVRRQRPAAGDPLRRPLVSSRCCRTTARTRFGADFLPTEADYTDPDVAAGHPRQGLDDLAADPLPLRHDGRRTCRCRRRRRRAGATCSAPTTRRATCWRA